MSIYDGALLIIWDYIVGTPTDPYRRPCSNSLKTAYFIFFWSHLHSSYKTGNEFEIAILSPIQLEDFHFSTPGQA